MKARSRRPKTGENRMTWSLAASVMFHILVCAFCATSSVFYPLTGHAEKFEFIWLASASLPNEGPDLPNMTLPSSEESSGAAEDGAERTDPSGEATPDKPAKNPVDPAHIPPPADIDAITITAASDRTKEFRDSAVKKKSEPLPGENDKTYPPEKELVATVPSKPRRDEEAEKAREEAERSARENEEQRARKELNARRLEEERLAAEVAERERIAREQAARDRLAAEKAEQERIEAARKTAVEQHAKEKARQERLAAEKTERERLAQERAALEKLASEKAEQDRIETARKAALEQQTKEKARQERLAAEKAERERIAREQAARDRLAAEKAEQERIAAARKAALEQQAKDKARQERLAAEKAERERLSREQAARDRLAAEKAEQERIAAARKAALEQQAKDKAKQARLAAERAERERIAREQAARDRLAAEKAEQERIAAARKAALEQQAKDKTRQERLAAERAERERVATNNRAVEPSVLKPEQRAGTATAGNPAPVATSRQKISDQVQSRDKPQAVNVAADTAQPILPQVYGDLKMVVDAGADLKISVLFREYPKSRRTRPMSRAEAARTKEVTPLTLKTVKDARELIVKNAGQGVYLFLAESAAGKGDRGQFTLKVFESTATARVKALGNRTVDGKTVIARVLMPEGIIWEDDSAFSGSYEDSDSTTKFNTETGLTWKEYKN